MRLSLRVVSLLFIVALAVALHAPPARAATSNPWGFIDGQTLTADQAADVVLAELNLARADHGLAPLPRSSDESGVDCAVNWIATSGVFQHHPSCMSPGRGEIIYVRWSADTITDIDAVDGWHDSPSHNRVLYAATGDAAAIALRCGPGSATGSRVLAAVQVIAHEGSIGARQVGGPNPTAAHPERDEQGVGCDHGTFVFRDDQPATEPAMPLDKPQNWHRFSVARLYSAYFSRYPDADGWSYWNRQITNGASLWQLSEAFAASDEFRIVYGNADSDRDFIDIVYRQVLGRPADRGGLQYWESKMAAGMSRGQIMVYFSESEEYVRASGPAITGKCWNGTVVESYRCAAPTTPAAS